MDISVIVVGAMGGLGYGLLGAAKNAANKDSDKSFSYQHLAKSVVTGAIVGGAVAYGGGTVSFETIEGFAATSAIYPMITAVVNKVTGIVYNMVKRV